MRDDMAVGTVGAIPPPPQYFANPQKLEIYNYDISISAEQLGINRLIAQWI